MRAVTGNVIAPPVALLDSENDRLSLFIEGRDTIFLTGKFAETWIDGFDQRGLEFLFLERLIF